MPGLIGFTDRRQKCKEHILLNMRDLLRHFDFYVDDELFTDRRIYASRTHLGIIDQGTQPCVTHNKFFSWMEGEFYNQSELRKKYGVTALTDIELLSDIFCKTRSFEFLREIDGVYAAVMYDCKEQKIYLISDRYGLNPLYWGIVDSNLMWASEIKAFLVHPDFSPRIDRQSVKEFIDIGHLLENRTWFEGIELVSPASILEYDVNRSKFSIHNYWSWNEIGSIQERVDESEIIEELGRLFTSAVQKHINNNERIGITLSGGLDSRAILAAIPEDYEPLHIFTFGKIGCDDIRIAKVVSKIKGGQHHVFLLDSDTWITPRIDGIWKTDGMFNLFHMHEVSFNPQYKNSIDVSINGFLGGAILGGFYLDGYPDKSEEYTTRNRGRRFINQGQLLAEKWIIIRRPFFSNDLIELSFSIPKNLKRNSYIYNKMLLCNFPKYYKHIPWQNTGCPIGWPELTVKAIRFSRRVKNKVLKETNGFGFGFTNSKPYHDYSTWVRDEPARSFFIEQLDNSDSLYQTYISRRKVKDDLKDHLGGKNKVDVLCRYLTFEIWLQQVFNGRYRDGIQDTVKHSS